jgi:hypothetical protein
MRAGQIENRVSDADAMRVVARTPRKISRILESGRFYYREQRQQPCRSNVGARAQRACDSRFGQGAARNSFQPIVPFTRASPRGIRRIRYDANGPPPHARLINNPSG